jgi:hypothetical protein
MPATERATIAQGVQIGVETTPGVAVPAPIQLLSMGFSPAPQSEFASFRPMGLKYRTIEALVREWSEAPIEGYPTYNEIVYPLNGILVATTPVIANVAVQRWTFDPASASEDTVKTFTVERGGAIQAERVANGIITAFNLGFTRTASPTMGGTMLGKQLETGITMTATPTGLDLVPMLPGQVSVFLDTTFAGLGTTKLTRLLSWNWALSNRFGPEWVLDDALDSFVTHVELEPTNQIEIMVQANSAGMAILENARNGDKRWIQMKATSNRMIPGTTPPTPYSFTFKAAVEVGGIGPLADSDGVYAGQYTLTIVHDATWGQAYEVIVDNDLDDLTP